MEQYIREPIVCGQFYPKSLLELNEMIQQFNLKVPSTKIAAKGVILPHAGYIYSGKVAAMTISQIQSYSKILILGTNHTGYGEPFSIYPRGRWVFPWKDFYVDEELVKKILKKSKFIKEDILAHKFEHSLEVEIPLFYYFLKDFKIIPIVCAMASLKTIQEVGRELGEIIREEEEDILVVASTDLSHYEPDSETRIKDREVIEYILNLDEEGLYNVVRKKNISMCGLPAVGVFISCMKVLKAKKASLVLYQTSGDVTGDYSSVVGYVGIVVH